MNFLSQNAKKTETCFSSQKVCFLKSSPRWYNEIVKICCSFFHHKFRSSGSNSKWYKNSILSTNSFLINLLILTIEIQFPQPASFSFTKTQKNLAAGQKLWTNFSLHRKFLFRSFPSPHVQDNLICLKNSPMNVCSESGHFYMEHFLSDKGYFLKKLVRDKSLQNC